MELGTDPEFFIFDKKTKKFISGSEVFPEKKEAWTPDRYWIDPKTKLYKWISYAGTKVFHDGFAVEINCPPSTCREALTAYIINAVVDINKRLKEENPNWELVSSPVAKISQAYIDTLPESVKMFGCDPSYSAWSEREERINLNGATHHYRYAGGHMHFGDGGDYPTPIHPGHHASKEGRARIFKLIRVFDLFIGLPLSLIFNDKGEFMRRRYYGRAGEFRFQPWGIEYRTPSSRLWNHPLVASMAFGVGRSLIQFYGIYGGIWDKLSKNRPHFEEDLLMAVNEGKGGEDLVQFVDNFYNKKTISFLSKEGKKLFKLSELTLPSHASTTGFATSLRSVSKGHLIEGYEGRA